jgi:hypothetical protein
MRHLKSIIAYLTAVALLNVAPAGANGTPLKVFLSCLPEITNACPAQASGQAQVSIGEAWVDLTADGLTQLKGEMYEAWLKESGSNRMISLGRFNADASHHVAFHAELGSLAVADYRYFLVTIEPEPDPDPAPGQRVSIAGVIPSLTLQIVRGTPTPTLPPGVTPTPGPPSQLPATGSAATPVGALLLVVLGLGLAVSLASRPALCWSMVAAVRRRLIRKEW